jgi:hypothetical protein
MSTEQSQIAWAEAAAQKVNAISRLHKRGIILNTITNDGLHQAILDIQEKYSSRWSARLYRKLRPVIAHLSTFSAAIGVLAQAGPPIACLVSPHPVHSVPMEGPKPKNTSAHKLIIALLGMGERSTCHRCKYSDFLRLPSPGTDTHLVTRRHQHFQAHWIEF